MGDFYTNAVRHPEDVGVGHIRRTLTLAQLSSPPTSDGMPIGALEAGAIPFHVQIYVEQAFNAGTTNTLDVGVPGTAAGFAAAASTLVGATGFKGNLTGTLTGIPLAADSVVYAKYAQTGAAATTGKVIVTLYFVNKREHTGIPWPAN